MKSLYFLLFLLLFVSNPLLQATCLVPTPVSPIVHSFETGLDGFANVLFTAPGFTNFNAVQATAPSPGNGPQAALEGTGYLSAVFPTSPGSPDWVVVLYSPCYDLSNLTNPELHLPLFVGAGGPFSSSFQVSVDGGQTWLTSFGGGNNPPQYAPVGREAGWLDAFVDLSGLAGSTDFRFRIAITAPASFGQEVAFDAIRIGEALCSSTPAADLLSYTTTAAGVADGAVDLTVTGGTAPLTYDWSNGATTEDLAAVGSGIYNLTVTDALGCFASQSIYVSEPMPNQGTKNGGYPYLYDFELNGLGLLKQNRGDDTNWRRQRGSTPTPETGPQTFIPYPAGDQFRYIEAGNGNSAKAAVLTVKKKLNLTGEVQPVAQIAWNLYGTEQGTFGVEVSADNGATWRRSYEVSGQQGWFWQTATVDLSAVNSGNTRIRLVGETSGNGPKSDLAIDQFYLGAAAAAPASVQRAPLTPAKAPRETVAWLDGSRASLLLAGIERPVETITNVPTASASPENIESVFCSDCVFEKELLSPYPNPIASGQLLTVRSSVPLSDKLKVEFPGNGMQTIFPESKFEFRLSVPSVPPGIYYLRVLLGDKILVVPILII